MASARAEDIQDLQWSDGIGVLLMSNSEGRSKE